MTRAAKALVFAVLIFSVTFMGFALLVLAGSTNWKERGDELAKQVDAQRPILTKQQEELPKWESRPAQAEQSIKTDRQGLDARGKVLEQQLRTQSGEIVKGTQEVVKVTKQAEAVRADGQRLRDMGVLLANQLDELRTQKKAALDEQQRLKDQLFQMRGNLERAERRKALLEQDGGKLSLE